jgi:phenylacetate-coenzyme A ligase PaaK-like adenylate-forming protein
MIDFGVFGLSSGGGKTLGTSGNLKLMAKMNPDVVVAMPTFLYHLLSQALEEGLRFPKLGVLVLGGEKVPDGLRKRLAALAEAAGGSNVRVMATYGFTEVKLAWGECPGAPDTPTGYHIPPEYAYFEVIDPDTGQVLPLGQPGELVVTPIDARGSVVLRYRTGDRVDGGLVYGVCPHCGLNVPRIIGKIARRSDVREMNIDKLKGTLIDFNALEHLLDSIDGLESYQVELAKQNDDPLDLDLLLIHAVARDGADCEALSERIRSTFRESMEITPNAVTYHTRAEMASMQGVGAELKERRVVDRRPRC